MIMIFLYKYMCNKKIYMDKETFKKKHKKWSDASVRLLQLRFEIEALLNSFSEEEKCTLQYRLLLESLKSQCDYLIQSAKKDKKIYHSEKDSDSDLHHIKTDGIKNQKSKASLSESVLKYSYKFKYIIVATLGAIALKLIELLTTIINHTGGNS